MQMPYMDGIMLGRTIKLDERIKDVCLIMMTSLGQQNIPQLAEIGFTACMTKPVRPSELYARLTEAISGAAKLVRSATRRSAEHNDRDEA